MADDSTSNATKIEQASGLIESVLANARHKSTEPDEDPWTDTQVADICGAVKDHCGPATAARLRRLIQAAQAPAPITAVWRPVSEPLEYLTRCSDGTVFANHATIPAHAVQWAIAAQGTAVEQLIPQGFRVEHRAPSGALTDEANDRTKWLVERTEAPYTGRDRLSKWTGPTLADAMRAARESLPADLVMDVPVQRTGDSNG